MSSVTTKRGTEGDLEVAFELATSVWWETATHLLMKARESHGKRDLSGAEEPGEDCGQCNAAEYSGEEKSGTDVLSVLSWILRMEGGALGVDPEGTHKAASVLVESSENLAAEPSADTLRLAALRVLLHTCRASPSVALAFAASGGGAAIPVMLQRLNGPIGMKSDSEVR